MGYLGHKLLGCEILRPPPAFIHVANQVQRVFSVYKKFPFGGSAFYLSQVPFEGTEGSLGAYKTTKGMELVITMRNL